jgi:hypothetical protein
MTRVELRRCAGECGQAVVVELLKGGQIGGDDP